MTARAPGAAIATLSITVNGRPRTIEVAAHHTLLEALRDDLGLTGTKECCLVGECGACTVIADGRSVDSCLVLAAEVDGSTITTVEGLARDGELSRLQDAFLRTGAAQCGFCIPGQLLSAQALLSTDPHPGRAEVEEGLAGNLCRCAGYEQIIEAVLLAAAEVDTEADDEEPMERTADLPGGAADRSGEVAADPARPDPAATPDARVAPQ